MCDPISLGLMALGGGASVLGGGMSASETANNNAAIAAARNKALQETNAKNLAISGQSRDAMGKEIAATTGPMAAAGLAGAQGGAVNTIMSNMAPTGGEPTLSSSAPKAAQSGLAAAIAAAHAKSTAKGAAQGNLLGYQTYGRDVAEQDKDLASGINMNNDFVHGNMAILPSIQDYEQIQANKPSSGLGELLQGLGSAAGGYAGNRAGARGYSIY